MKKLLLTIIIYFMMLSASYAYLDPGTGSIILQVILVALATCAAVFTNFWKKLKGLFLKIFTSKKNNDKENITKKN